jgi:hypothetical protein
MREKSFHSISLADKLTRFHHDSEKLVSGLQHHILQPSQLEITTWQLTEAVKDELKRLSVTKPCCRKTVGLGTFALCRRLAYFSRKIIIEVERDMPK